MRTEIPNSIDKIYLEEWSAVHKIEHLPMSNQPTACVNAVSDRLKE